MKTAKKKGKKIDWNKIKNDYIFNNFTLRGLADKYGINLSNLSAHCKKEKWIELREEKQNEINQLCASKKHLWRHLKVSSKRKYRIEYKLFSLIPNHPLLAYKLMKKLS